jgi:hypothetical protein
MRIIGSGGQDIEDTSSPAYTAQANKLLKTTEQSAQRQRQLEAQNSGAAKNQEEQRLQITNLSAEKQVLQLKLKEQQRAQLEQTNTERNHRFTSNADLVQSLIDGEIIKLSKTDGSNPASARETVSATLANLNSAPDSLSFGPIHSETIIPESFTKEKLGLEELTKDESLLLTKLILSINGIKYTENQDGRLSDISNPKTNLFIPKAHLNYQEAIVLEPGTQKVDIFDALSANHQLTQSEAEKLIRNLLQREGIEFTEGVNSVLDTKEFRFPEALSTKVSLGETTLVDGVIGESINIPSTDILRSMIETASTKKRNVLFRKLWPLAIAATTILPAGVLINNPEIIGLEKPTPATRLLQEEEREINALKLRHPTDDRIENSTEIRINHEQGENVSQALSKVYPGYLDLAHMQRQEIEHRLLNKLGIPNDIKVYPHGGDVISRLPSQIEVPSIRDIYLQIKSLSANKDSRQGSSLTDLYYTLTKRTPIN